MSETSPSPWAKMEKVIGLSPGTRLYFRYFLIFKYIFFILTAIC